MLMSAFDLRWQCSTGVFSSRRCRDENRLWTKGFQILQEPLAKLTCCHLQVLMGQRNEEKVQTPSALLNRSHNRPLRKPQGGALTHNSVGQRPTSRFAMIIKAEGLAQCGFRFLMCKAFSLDIFACRFVGRCPTLICVRPSALWVGFRKRTKQEST